MSQFQKGPSPSGLSGILGQILPDGSQVALFQGTFYTWSIRRKSDQRPRFGPDTGGYLDFRNVRDDSFFAFSGVTSFANGGKPEPANYKGQKTFVRVQYGTNQVAQENGVSPADAAYTITRQTIIDSFEIEDDETEKPTPSGPGFWKSSGTGRIIGPPVYSAAWGTLPDAGAVTKSDQQLYQGMELSRDPFRLIEGDTYVVDYWGLTTDDNPGRLQRLLQAVAAAIPQDIAHKLREVKMLPDSPDGGSFQFTFGLTSTADDVTNPFTSTEKTPFDVDNKSSAAALNTQPGSPGVLNTELVSVSTLKLNDLNTRFVCEFGKWNEYNAITKGGTFANTDPLTIADTGQSVVIFNTGDAVPAFPTPPSGQQVVTYKIDNISSFQETLTTQYGKRTTMQEKTFPRINTGTDPNNIYARADRAQFWAVGTSPPALPIDLPTGNVKLIGFDDIPDTPTIGSVPGQNIRIWTYGPADSADEKILPNTQTTSDSNALASTGMRACLDGSSNPSTIVDAFGNTLVTRTTRAVPITIGLGINRILYVTEYGLRDTKADITDPESEIIADPLAIDSSAKTTEVFPTGSPPSNPAAPLPEVQITAQRMEVLNTIESKRTTTFEPLTSELKRGLEKWQTSLDLNNIENKAVRFKFWLSNTSQPSAPDDPPTNDVKVLSQETIEVTRPIGMQPGINMDVFIYAAQDTADKQRIGSLFFRHRYGTITDSTSIGSTAMRAWLDGESVINTVTDGNGIVLVLTKLSNQPLSLNLATNRTLFIGEYAQMTSADEINFRSSPIESDFADGFKQRISSLVPSDTTVSLGDFRIAQENLAKGVPTYVGLNAQQFNRDLKLLELLFLQDSKKVSCKGGSRPMMLNNFGNQLYIPYVIPRGSNGTTVFIQKREIWRGLAEMRVFRRFTTPMDPDDTLLHSGQWNNTNISRFGPFNIGFALFSFADFVYAGGQTTLRPIGIEYIFKIDTLGFQPTLPGGEVPSPAIGLTPGLHVWSDLLLGAYPDPPTRSDFSFAFFP